MGHRLTLTDVESIFDPQREASWVSDFLSFDTRGFERLWREAGEAAWQKAGERRALRIFHGAARRVPAYRDFLKRHKIWHEHIKTMKDFSEIPLTDKTNYVGAYPLAERMWDGKLERADLVAVSSGTTGEPKFWPRSGFQEFEAAVVHELLYRSLFDIDRRKTLLIIGFPMGVYVSGVATLLPTSGANAKLPKLTVVSAGNNKPEVLRVLRHLREAYEQIVVVGHPLFAKDVIETGIAEGISWSSLGVKLFLCSEGFSEAWREYVLEKIGRSAHPFDTAFSLYGSSEFLLMAYETPLSIFIRTQLESRPRFREHFSGRSSSVPNLFQYNPFLRYVESIDDNLVFTAASGVPLIRFNLKDAGRTISFAEMTSRMGEEGITWRRELARRAPGRPIWNLPFLALRGRSDHTMIFYAANIYPEHIHGALSYRNFFGKLTGKFSLQKVYAKNMDEILKIAIELRPGVRPQPALSRMIQQRIISHLLTVNMEYAFLWDHLDKDIRPRVVLRPYQDPRYFKVGLKPRYIITES